MSYEWPLTKLAVINSALAQTSDNAVSALNDGSDEYTVASPAYERALAYMIEQHNWLFGKSFATLTAGSVAPTDTQYDTTYALPADLVHVIQVRVAGIPSVYDFQMGPPIAGVPQAMQLVVNAQGGPPPPDPPATPAEVTLQYISQTSADPSFSTPTFVLALVAFVMSGIYRGLHEDSAEADKMWEAGEKFLMRAEMKHDQQRPKMQPFNSRITASRGVRRPWPRTPGGWGGTGIPG